MFIVVATVPITVKLTVLGADPRYVYKLHLYLETIRRYRVMLITCLHLLSDGNHELSFELDPNDRAILALLTIAFSVAKAYPKMNTHMNCIQPNE